MTSITPAARLKVKEDTFFLPVPDEGVYFRNNVGTFRMEGAMIDRWIEKLVPMFNGEHTMADLTNGLSSPHLERVYEIAEVLYRKGFVRDVSQDIPHQLTDGIMKNFAGQIAFLESFGDSGAYRFQCYRQADVLAVGSGPMFVSLVAALLESGLPKIHMLITESVPTNRERIVELANQARRTDPEVEVREIERRKEGADGWKEMVEPYQSIVYVSQKGDIDEFRLLHDVCKTEKKLLLPAMCLHQTGMAGPVVHPGSEGCWESAWRRVHPASVWKDPELHSFSTTAGAMLANVIVFELFKSMTGQSETRNSFFLLDLETLEGSWHSFIPHPMVNGFETNRAIQAPDLQLDGREETLVQGDPNRLLSYMSRLTSPQSGILHLWEEGDLRQLPLSQCRVQAVDPLSEGPAALLPEQIGVGLTHEEARREAGLLGIEAYVSRWAEKLVHTNEVIGIGAGATRAEGIVRGLQAHLSQQQSMQLRERVPSAARVPAGRVEDERCRYYLQQLSAWRRDPVIAFGEEIAGFPAVWVGFGDGWYGGSGLNKTAALRKALQGALLGLQNGSVPPADQVQTASSVRIVREVPGEITFPSIEGWSHSRSMQGALETISSQGKQLFVVDLAVEPFLKEELQGVFGVLLREGGSR